MSKVTIQGDASGTGIFTIASPNSNTDRTLVLPDEAGTVLTSAGVPASAMPAGSVLQVVQVVKTNAFAGSAGAQWADVSGLSATITPTSASNKVLVIVDMKGGGTADATTVRSRLVRNTTPIYFGDAAGVRPLGMGEFYISAGGAGSLYLAQLGGSFVDSPASTSPVTYKMQFGADNNTYVVYINRTQGDRNTTGTDVRSASSIILMEIAA